MEAVLGSVATAVAPKLIEMGTNAVSSVFTGGSGNTDMANCSSGMQNEAVDSAISDVHAPPVDVRLSAEPVPMVSQVKPYRTNNSMVSREKVSITPVRMGLGTNRYDLFDESATRVIKKVDELTNKTYGGYTDSIIGLLNLQDKGLPWVAYDSVATDGIIPFTFDGKPNPYSYGSYSMDTLTGNISLLQDGSYDVEVLIYSEDATICVPLRHFVKYKVKDSKYTEILILGPITALKALSAQESLYLRFAPVGPLQHDTAAFLASGTVDIFNYLSSVEKEAFSMYEAYSIDSFRIDLVDTANWIKTDTAILVYYVGDPDRWPIYGASHNMIDPTSLTTTTPVLMHEPHLQTVKIFKAGYNLSFEMPIPKNRFFTTYDGKTKRLTSPGTFSIVPLLPSGEGGHYNFTATITATIKFYCPTIRSEDVTFSHTVAFPPVWPGEYLLRQATSESEPYMELPLTHNLEHYRSIRAIDGAGFTAMVDGHECAFEISAITPHDDKLRVYVPQNLAILGNIFEVPKDITVTKFAVPQFCHVTEILAN